jgi:hypothetical protein
MTDQVSARRVAPAARIAGLTLLVVALLAVVVTTARADVRAGSLADPPDSPGNPLDVEQVRAQYDSAGPLSLTARFYQPLPDPPRQGTGGVGSSIAFWVCEQDPPADCTGGGAADVYASVGFDRGFYGESPDRPLEVTYQVGSGPYQKGPVTISEDRRELSITVPGPGSRDYRTVAFVTSWKNDSCQYDFAQCPVDRSDGFYFKGFSPEEIADRTPAKIVRSGAREQRFRSPGASAKFFVFEATCRGRGGCRVQLGAVAHAGRRTGVQRLRSLDVPLGKRQLRVPGRTTYRFWFKRSDFNQRRLNAAFGRYGAVTFVVSIVVTNAAGIETRATRSIVVRPYVKPKPKKRRAPRAVDPIVRAVKREIQRRFGIRFPDVTCRRLTTKRYRCDFKGLTDADVREGNVGGHSGIAYVTRYPYGIDVVVKSYGRG